MKLALVLTLTCEFFIVRSSTILHFSFKSISREQRKPKLSTNLHIFQIENQLCFEEYLSSWVRLSIHLFQIQIFAISLCIIFVQKLNEIKSLSNLNTTIPFPDHFRFVYYCCNKFIRISLFATGEKLIRLKCVWKMIPPTWCACLPKELNWIAMIE